LPHSTSAWLRLPALGATLVIAVGCALSLRGAANPGGSFGTPSPTAVGGVPRVEIASPQTGSSGNVGRSIDVDVRASDTSSIGISRLELFVDGKVVDRVMVGGGATRPNFAATLSWIPLGPGTFTLSALSYRPDGTASQPAEVIVIITGQAIQSQTPTPEPTPTPTPSPSGSQIPTVTLSPSPKPTPTPTPVPIGVHVEVWVEPAEMPLWTVGQRATLLVHVQNQGGYPVPYIRISSSLAGSADRGRTGAIGPGKTITLSLTLTPTKAGPRTLLFLGQLPSGFVDTSPQTNSLTWQDTVVVSPCATPEPTPTASPG